MELLSAQSKASAVPTDRKGAPYRLVGARLHSNRLEWSPFPIGWNEAPSNRLEWSSFPPCRQKGSIPTDWNGAPVRLGGTKLHSNRLEWNSLPSGGNEAPFKPIGMERLSSLSIKRPIPTDWNGTPFRLVETKLHANRLEWSATLPR